MKKHIEDLIEVIITMLAFTVGMFLMFFIFNFAWALVKSFFSVIF